MFLKSVSGKCKRANVVTAGSLIICLAAGTALAHHGWNGYDEQKEMKLTGVIQASTYGNPHGTMEFKVSGGNGKTWKTILAPPSRMTDRGLTAAMLKEGTTATVVGYPHMENSSEMRAERITINGKTTELR